MRNTYYQDEEVKQKFNLKSIKKIFRYVYKFKWSFTAVIILLSVSVLIALIPPLLVEKLADEVVVNEDYKGLAKIIISLVAIGLTDIIISFFYQFITGKTGQKIIYNLRKDVFDNLMNLPFEFFDNRPSGKIVIRVTNYVDEVANFFSTSLVNLVISVLRIFVVLIFMFYLNVRLTLVVLATMIPLLTLANFIRAKSKKPQRQCKAKGSNRCAFLVESIMGVKEIKSFNRREFNEQIYRKVQADAVKPFLDYIWVIEWGTITFEGIWNLGSMFLYGFAFYLIKGNIIAPGVLIAFLSYMGLVYEPFSTLSNIVQQLAQITSDLELILEIKDTPSKIIEKPDAIEITDAKGEIEFDDVTFGYEPDENVLEHFSLKVREGESVALVGATGSGKTTIINMLTRFYDVKEGAVRIDGIDVRDLKIKNLRNVVGVVMQDPFMFKGKIIDNIRYGKPGASDEECIEATKKIGAESFIEKLPQGYYTELGERGEGLSGGEKQLISFARIILENPKVFIFDEATSSIDSETEALIQGSLEKIIKGRTSFFVAHRLSTIKKSDRILFIGNKGIMEQGSFSELMDKKGSFYNLENS